MVMIQSIWKVLGSGKLADSKGEGNEAYFEGTITIG